MSTQITLSSGQTITLNEQQEEALQMMREWIRNPNDKFFALTGYAGTGKTTIAKEIIDEFLRNYHGEFDEPVVVSAPTNKAKNQIEYSTGLEGKTIQSLLGLSPNINLENFDINKPEFGQLRQPTLENHVMVVIDEFSMLNEDLTEMIVTTAEQYGTKILFMGDEAQLPPVNEKISAVIGHPSITSGYQLTQVMRQAGDNPLMLVYDSIRDNLNSTVDAFTKTSSMNDIGEGIEFLESLQSFGTKVVNEFASQAAIDNPLHCKVLCWTNDRVAFWNKAIRSALYAHYLRIRPDTSPEEKELWKILMPGDMLMAYTPSGSLVVSTEYMVQAIELTSKNVKYGSSNALSVGVICYNVRVINLQNGIERSMLIIRHDQENLTKFMVAFDYFLDQAKFNRKWKDYYNFKDQYHLLQDIKTGSGKLLLRKDIDYSYALTVHKSQGSTYQKVFMDMPDIDKNRNPLERNKLKYVALSRPRQAAIVLAA